MKTSDISFSVMKRKKVFAKNGHEWALMIHEPMHILGGYTLCTWDEKPTEKEVGDAMKLFRRSCEIYKRFITISDPLEELINPLITKTIPWEYVEDDR